jgi:cell division septation protein DedD
MPESAAPDQAAAALDRSPEMAMTSLFRAAIGPINSAYYLPIFGRFEAAGEATLSWNWSAGLYTLNWMLFRGLWGAALAFAGALVGVPLLLLALGRLVFDWPNEVLYELLLTCLLLACLVSGGWGNALLYNHSRKAMMVAVEANSSLAQACTQLSGQASSRQCFIRILLVNAVLAALLALAWVTLQDGPPTQAAAPVSPISSAEPAGSAPQAAGSAAQAPGVATSAAAPASEAASASASASAPAAALRAAPGAAVTAITTTALSAATTLPPAASAAASKASAAPGPAMAAALKPTPSLVVASAAASKTSATPGAGRSEALSVAPNLERTPAPVTKAAAGPALAPATNTASGLIQVGTSANAFAATPAHMTASAEKPKASHAKPALPASAKAGHPPGASAKQAASAAAKSASPAPGFLINAGLFAKTDNAHKALDKLKSAGLHAYSEELQTSQGPRTRVRVGPFAKRSQAAAAIKTIHAMKLDAALVKP